MTIAVVAGSITANRPTKTASFARCRNGFIKSLLVVGIGILLSL